MTASSVLTGTQAARPAASWNGRIYHASDGFSVQRDTGSVWTPFGPSLPLYDPTIPAFAFTNQGTATSSSTSGAVILTAPSTANDQLRILDVAAPGAPYTITVGFLPNLLFANFLAAGLCLRDSVGGGVVTFDMVARTAFFSTGFTMAASKWTSPTVFSAEYVLTGSPQPAAPWQIGPLMWLQVHDDNTNRIFSASNDGVTFVPLFSVARTDFITPNRVGIYVNPNGNGVVAVAASMTLISWRQQ